MNEALARVYLKDYRKPDYLVPQIDLKFELGEERTRVISQLTVQRNEGVDAGAPLVLNGENLDLVSVSINDTALARSRYLLDGRTLTIPGVPAEFGLEVQTELNPGQNLSGLGLYISDRTFCTQMEAEGFRRVTYFPDRPDVMSAYTTRIIGDRRRFPILLSNGNLIEQGEVDETRHAAVWHDPFAKPCYLFALVAGDLGLVQDSFQTMGGRKVDLRIFVDKGNESRAAHAMQSLKQAMRWDEEVFGLEYDLDIFMLVAVNAFNFGAMENKGLNIFNAKYVLADPQTATDEDFEAIAGVVAHEYFHNWTGDRVTCRDWFQLTLKEGLTVFRDQEFSADHGSRAVQRISDMRTMKSVQFMEDAGPNAHPIKPCSYAEIDNFYTSTVYEKGAEVIRMVETLIGRNSFRRGITRYFELFDGRAVTTEDFLRAMADASGCDFTQFQRWYDQAGTPVCRVQSKYDPEARSYELSIDQRCPPTPGQPEKRPFVIPIAIGLLDSRGRDMPLSLEGEAEDGAASTKVLTLSQSSQVFRFKNVAEKPVPSLLRNFSAPVRLEYPYTVDELAFLLAHDSDPVNRFEAGQRLALREITGLLRGEPAQASLSDSIQAFDALLRDQHADEALRAEILTLPSLELIVETQKPYDYQRAETARLALAGLLSKSSESVFNETYRRLEQNLRGEYKTDAASIGKRRLKNVCLWYLARGGAARGLEMAVEQFRTAGNMTDSLAALRVLNDFSIPARTQALAAFLERWKGEPLVMDKWFALQAGSGLPDVIEQVKQLEVHPSFDAKNPNKLRALYSMLALNYPRFHAESGEGYRFIADKVLTVDRFNPNVAARLAKSFDQYMNLDPGRRACMKVQLERIAGTPGISKGVEEIVVQTLGERE